MNKADGIDLTHVPYKGAARRRPISGRQVERDGGNAALVSGQSAAAMSKSGAVSDQRHPDFPDIPPRPKRGFRVSS